jgi:hypothetical protein
MTNDDGTQDPVPPPVLADPLAGLVTGAGYQPEPLRVRVTEPPMPDIAAVREAMASVLDENSELDLSAIVPAEAFFTDSAGTTRSEQAAPAPDAAAPAQPVAQVPVAQVPTQEAGTPAQAPVTRAPGAVPTRGAVTRVTPPAIPAQRGAGGTARALPPATTRGEDTRRIRLPRGFMRQRPEVPAGAKGPSSAGSVTLIMVLLLVMVVLGIVALASLVDTIASVFD